MLVAFPIILNEVWNPSGIHSEITTDYLRLQQKFRKTVNNPHRPINIVLKKVFSLNLSPLSSVCELKRFDTPRTIKNTVAINTDKERASCHNGTEPIASLVIIVIEEVSGKMLKNTNRNEFGCPIS